MADTPTPAPMTARLRELMEEATPGGQADGERIYREALTLIRAIIEGGNAVDNRNARAIELAALAIGYLVQTRNSARRDALDDAEKAIRRFSVPTRETQPSEYVSGYAACRRDTLRLIANIRIPQPSRLRNRRSVR